MATPLFILGYPRSGTTWLANMLCGHSKIAGIQEAKHWGIIESAYFRDIYDRYGDLQEQSNYMALIQILQNSDYFRHINISNQELISNFPISYSELFRLYMDRYADQNNASYWLEKTPAHTLYSPQLIKMYPDAKFIVVRRNILAALSSQVNMFKILQQNKNNLGRLRKIITLVRKYNVYDKYVRKINNYSSVLVLDYENIIHRTGEEMKIVNKFLGIDIEKNVLTTKYKKNTSFTGKSDKFENFKKHEVNLIRILNKFFAISPLFFLIPLKELVFSVLKKYFNIQSKPLLPHWFYDSYLNELSSIANNPKNEDTF